MYSWYNLTSYPSEFFGPTAAEASQAQAFVFLARDQKMGAKVASGIGPTGQAKYLMRSPSGEIILGGETMRFWSMSSAWLEPLRNSRGIDLNAIRYDLCAWQERRAGDAMTHAPLGSINSVGGLATEINGINYCSPRSWLTSAHWALGFMLFVGHWWHAGRSRAAAAGMILGLSRRFEPALFMRPID